MSLSLVGWSTIRRNDLDDENVAPGAKVTVRKLSDNSIVNIYRTDNLSDPQTNPFYSDSVGDFNLPIPLK